MKKLTFNDLSLDKQTFLKLCINKGFYYEEAFKEKELNRYIDHLIHWQKSYKGSSYWVKTYQKVVKFNEFLTFLWKK